MCRALSIALVASWLIAFEIHGQRQNALVADDYPVSGRRCRAGHVQRPESHAADHDPQREARDAVTTAGLTACASPCSAERRLRRRLDPERKPQGFPAIALERTSVTGLEHIIGTVSMARDGPDTATSDFFILLNDQPSLDFGGKRFDDGQGAAAFGRVVAGMAVVQQIQRRPTEGQNLSPPIRIISATRVTP